MNTNQIKVKALEEFRNEINKTASRESVTFLSIKSLNVCIDIFIERIAK